MLVISSSTDVSVSIGIEDDLKPKAEHQSKDFWNLVLGLRVRLCRPQTTDQA